MSGNAQFIALKTAKQRKIVNEHKNHRATKKPNKIIVKVEFGGIEDQKVIA